MLRYDDEADCKSSRVEWFLKYIKDTGKNLRMKGVIKRFNSDVLYNIEDSDSTQSNALTALVNCCKTLADQRLALEWGLLMAGLFWNAFPQSEIVPLLERKEKMPILDSAWGFLGILELSKIGKGLRLALLKNFKPDKHLFMLIADSYQMEEKIRKPDAPRTMVDLKVADKFYSAFSEKSRSVVPPITCLDLEARLGVSRQVRYITNGSLVGSHESVLDSIRDAIDISSGRSFPGDLLGLVMSYVCTGETLADSMRSRDITMVQEFLDGKHDCFDMVLPTGAPALMGKVGPSGTREHDFQSSWTTVWLGLHHKSVDKDFIISKLLEIGFLSLQTSVNTVEFLLNSLSNMRPTYKSKLFGVIGRIRIKGGLSLNHAGAKY